MPCIAAVLQIGEEGSLKPQVLGRRKSALIEFLESAAADFDNS
jgi:hypothetical protein